MKCWQSVSDLHGAGAFDGVRSNLKVCPGRLRCGLAKRNVSRIALNNSRQRHGTATFPQGRRKRCLPSLQSSPAEGPASELQHQRKNKGSQPPPGTQADLKWQQHVLFCGVGLGLASVHRVTLAILAVPFQEQFFITLPQMGVLQSAMLWGYVLGQLPTGLLADKWGGSLLMTLSLVSWCFASLLMPFAVLIPGKLVFYFIFLARFLLGLFQSGIVTSTAAMSSRWVPEKHRSKAMGFCYFLYSGGVVVGLWATPLVARPLGWQAVYIVYTAIGLAWAAYGAFGLPSEPEANYLPVKKVKHGEGPATAGFVQLSRSTKLQVAVLIWTHSVIGWGFTLLQNWIPTILIALGMTDLGSVGLVSALPWVAASGVSLAGGFIADWLYKEQSWSLVEVRRFCQNLASLGPAIALLTLAVGGNIDVSMAVALLVAAAGLQAFAYAGFHSYAQDVCPKDVGRLLGLTNTGGTVVGVVCNLLTGSLAGSPLGFSSVFYICAAVYLSSFITWNLFMKGEDVQLT